MSESRDDLLSQAHSNTQQRQKPEPVKVEKKGGGAQRTVSLRKWQKNINIATVELEDKKLHHNDLILCFLKLWLNKSIKLIKVAAGIKCYDKFTLSAFKSN